MSDSEGESGANNLSEVLDRLGDLARDKDRVSVADVRETFGDRGFGPFLLLPALLEISPIGGIPGVPTLLAIVISLFAIQIVFGRRHLWLPGFAERWSVGAERFGKAVAWLRPAARWTDKLIRPRLRWLTKRPWLNVGALLCIAMAATVPALELVPFASTLPMGAIALFGIAILARDGLAAILAAVLSAGSIYALLTLTRTLAG